MNNLIGEAFYYAEEAYTALKVMKNTGLPSVITIAPMGENMMSDGVHFDSKNYDWYDTGN